MSLMVAAFFMPYPAERSDFRLGVPARAAHPGRNRIQAGVRCLPEKPAERKSPPCGGPDYGNFAAWGSTRRGEGTGLALLHPDEVGAAEIVAMFEAIARIHELLGEDLDDVPVVAAIQAAAKLE